MKLKTGFQGVVQDHLRRDLTPVKSVSHFGMSSGSPVTDAGVVRAGTGFQGFFDDVVSWGTNAVNDVTGAVTEATGISSEDQLTALQQGGMAVAGSVMYQGGASPQVVTQSSNVQYPGLPPGAVPIPASFEATLKKYGLSKEILVYGGAAVGGLVLLLLLWPKKKRSSGPQYQPVYVTQTLPGTTAGMPVQANPKGKYEAWKYAAHMKKARKDFSRKLKQKKI